MIIVANLHAGDILIPGDSRSLKNAHIYNVDIRRHGHMLHYSDRFFAFYFIGVCMARRGQSVLIWKFKTNYIKYIILHDEE